MPERERRPKAPHHNQHNSKASARPGRGGVCYYRLRGFTLDEARRALTPGLRRVHAVSKLGQTVEVTILQIDPEKHRIGLSMAASERAEEAANAEHGRAATQAPAKLGTFGDLLAKASEKNKKKR